MLSLHCWRPWLFRHNLPLVKPSWLFLITSLFSICFNMSSMTFHDVTGPQDEPCWSVVPRVLLIILFENVCNIPFSLVIGSTTWLPWLFTSHSPCFYASWSFANTYIQKMLMEFEAENVGTIDLLHCLSNITFSY